MNLAETTDFGGLRIEFDDRVLRPRAWTIAQSYWAAELAGWLPDGDVLELCSGAGQIGLLAAHRLPRRLVCVDVDPAAVQLIRRNAAAAGMAERVEARLGPMRTTVRADELFPLIVADPPWVPRHRVNEFPDDPVLAIDGGDQGTEVARECLEVIAAHLAPGGASVLQLGDEHQVAALAPRLAEAGLRVREIRSYDAHGVLVRIDRTSGPTG